MNGSGQMNALQINKLLCCLALLLFSVLAKAQPEKTKIELLGANKLKFDKSLGVQAQRLIGNVRFRHQGAVMSCDSAYLYEQKNTLNAFGNVHVNQGDTIHLYGNLLHYNGNTRIAEVRDSIRLRDGSMQLFTDILNYDRNTNVAEFFDGGKIINSENDNVLTSREGFYYATEKTFIFRDSVNLLNPEYNMVTDTLRFVNPTGVAYFFGPTYIYSEANTIYCENGWYDTENDVAQFNENAYILTEEQKLSGDSLYYNRNLGLGRAYEQVLLEDSVDAYAISGHFGEHLERSGESYVTGRALFMKYNQQDTLFLHADTLRARQDSISGDRVLAYNQVRFYRKDLQGAADSLAYSGLDSVMTMYGNPVLWTDDLQITGDTISLFSKNEQLSKLLIYPKAYMVSEVDSSSYDQIKGQRMTGHFRDNDLYRLDVDGNGQALVYIREETDDGKPGEVQGINQKECSSMQVYFQDREVQRIVYLTNPTGTYYPTDQFPEEKARYEGFSWQAYRRPENPQSVFEIPEKPEEQPTPEKAEKQL